MGSTSFLTALTLWVAQAPSLNPGDVTGRADEPVKELEGVGIQPKLGAAIPKDLVFRDFTGKPVALGKILDDDRPVVLTFNYSDCPMLCSLQLSAFADTLKVMRWDLGKEYQVVTVSLDPSESPAKAERTRKRYLDHYGRPLPEGEVGWHFLVGDEPSIRKLADIVGFGYAKNPDNGEYLHTASLIILSGQDKVARYMDGIQYSPETLRLSLAESADGKFTSAIDHVVLYCFKYDPKTGAYTPVVSNIMRLGAAVTILILALVMGRAFIRRNAAHRHDTPAPERSNVT